MGTYWRIAVYEDGGRLIGVCANNLDYEQAIRSLPIVRHSFARGLDFFKDKLRTDLYGTWVDVKEFFPPED